MAFQSVSLGTDFNKDVRFCKINDESYFSIIDLISVVTNNNNPENILTQISDQHKIVVDKIKDLQTVLGEEAKIADVKTAVTAFLAPLTVPHQTTSRPVMALWWSS